MIGHNYIDFHGSTCIAIVDQTGSHDSGISQCTRMSQTSTKDGAASPPPPPRCSVDSQYIDMTGQLQSGMYVPLVIYK